MFFINVVSYFCFFRLSKLMGNYSKTSKKEQCIWYPEAQIENVSCKPMMQTSNKKLQKNKHNWLSGGEEPNTGNGS